MLPQDRLGSDSGGSAGKKLWATAMAPQCTRPLDVSTAAWLRSRRSQAVPQTGTVGQTQTWCRLRAVMGVPHLGCPWRTARWDASRVRFEGGFPAVRVVPTLPHGEWQTGVDAGVVLSQAKPAVTASFCTRAVDDETRRAVLGQSRGCCELSSAPSHAITRQFPMSPSASVIPCNRRSGCRASEAKRQAHLSHLLNHRDAARNWPKPAACADALTPLRNSPTLSPAAGSHESCWAHGPTSGKELHDAHRRPTSS